MPERITVESIKDNEHWMTVRELWMRKDKEQCESWKDEVQNVLIFSGLFSAIVTAFLVESHKALRPDPAEESVQLLRQIAAQAAGQTWVAGSEPRIDHTVNVCVNIFWFLSLVLSLTAALIGIVSLQWIRTHLRALSDGPESLGLSHMHTLGLQKSYIPLIFASLPVLLIFGLAFFLVGLIAFLFELSWPVAIPVAIAIGFTFAFLLTTTLHPALQSFPEARPSDNPDCFPSPYRSPQSLLFLRWRDWWLRSQKWLRRRQEDFGVEKRQLSHLEYKPKDPGPMTVFAYDTIEALVAVQESRSAESEKERTALAKCLAEVLPIHLELFTTGDLADLIPFLPSSEYVPSAQFSRENSVTREDLGAVALVQIATCKGGRPFQTPALTKACVLTTRWLFERPRTFDSVPDSQPLQLISKPGEVSPDDLEVLIGTLIRFFTYAVDFHPESQIMDKTTYTSSYTYRFLVLSAEILTECSLSSLSHALQARHAYLLTVITTRLDQDKACDYLLITAWIYASIISKSKVCSSPSGAKFLRTVASRRDKLADLKQQQRQLWDALKADEVRWNNIDRAIASDAPFVVGANNVAPPSRRFPDGEDSSQGIPLEEVVIHSES